MYVVGRGCQQHVSRLHIDADASHMWGMGSTEIYNQSIGQEAYNLYKKVQMQHLLTIYNDHSGIIILF